MFDSTLPGPAALPHLEDAALISAIQDWARASAAADARMLAAVAELVRRRCADELHPDWTCDDYDAAAAELSCAMNMSHGRAMGQMDLAVALRDRFPKVGARLLAGEIELRAAATIVDRTALVYDGEALSALDTAMSEDAASWGPLSKYKLEQAIDSWVDQIDPDAVRRTRNSSRNRYVTVGSPTDKPGFSTVYGVVTKTDGDLFDQRLNSVARTVCDDDPRTLDQRRSDAMGAIGAGFFHLACRCDNPDCTAAADDGRASSVVVHVVAEKESLSEPVDPLLDGEGLAPATETRHESGDRPEARDRHESGHRPRRKPAILPGAKGGLVPSPVLADLIAHGAKVREVAPPAAEPEKQYRPSTALQDFVRTRDLTCRFPGCERPAMAADIDHTVPWPAGPTHASNNVCQCRLHHLLKTFWAGWSHSQRPDGRLIVTTPSGHAYTTKPFSTLLFPASDAGSAPVRLQRPKNDGAASRELKMPTRRISRVKARQYRINAERAANALEFPERSAERAEPPPF